MSTVQVIVQKQQTTAEVVQSPAPVTVTTEPSPVSVVNQLATATRSACTPRVYEVTAQGPAGPAGADGDKHYTHTQAVPAATWVIDHGLNKRPSVTVVDSAGSVVIGEIEYDTADQLTLYFSSSFAGAAYFN